PGTPAPAVHRQPGAPGTRHLPAGRGPAARAPRPPGSDPARGRRAAPRGPGTGRGTVGVGSGSVGGPSGYPGARGCWSTGPMILPLLSVTAIGLVVGLALGAAERSVLRGVLRAVAGAWVGFAVGALVG